MTSMTRWTIAAAVALAAITAAGACEDHAKAAADGETKAAVAEGDAKCCSMPCCAHGSSAEAAAAGGAPAPAVRVEGAAASAPCAGSKHALQAKDGSPATAVPAQGATASAPCAGKSGCAKKAATVATDRPAKDVAPAEAAASAGAHR